MAEIDASIPLRGKLPDIMNPRELMSLQQVAQQGQMQQMQMANMMDERGRTQAVRQALQAEGSTDPATGRLTPTALQAVTRLNPELGFNLTRQQEQLRLMDVAMMDKRNELSKNIGTTYVTAYDRYSQQFGGNTKQAEEMARRDTLAAIEEMNRSGTLKAKGLDDQAISDLVKLPSPEVVRAHVMALGGRLDKPVDPFEGKYEAKDYTPESWAAFKRTHDTTLLRVKAPAPPTGHRFKADGTLERIPGYDPGKEGGGGPTEGAGRSYIPPQHANLHGEEYLATLAPGVRSSVKAIAEGRAPLSSLSIRGGEREAMLQRAAQFDPTFDAGIAPARVATRRDFTSGPASRNVTAINTAIGHLGSLDELGDALKNKDTRLLNSVFNRIATETGNANVNNFEIARDAVGHELMRVFRQVGASKEESDAFQAKFKSANSPEQLKGAVKTAGELLQSRIEALDDQWKRGMNTDKGYPDLLSPKSQKVMERVKTYGTKAPAGGAGNFSNLWR